MVRINHLQSAADGIAVEVLRHAEFGVDGKGVLDEGDGGEQGGAETLIIIRCGAEGVEEGGFVVVNAGVVGVGIEIGKTKVDAAFSVGILPSEIFADGEAVFIGIGAKGNLRPCGGGAEGDKRGEGIVQLQFQALVSVVFEGGECLCIGVVCKVFLLGF